MSASLTVYDLRPGDIHSSSRGAAGVVGGVRENEPLNRIGELLVQPECLLWLDITDPQESDFKLLREQLSIHPLTLEDIQQTRQRPKLDSYDGYFFMVAYETCYDESKHKIGSEEINLIIGKSYLVTVHQHPTGCLDSARARGAKPPIEDVSFLAYLIVDSIVDGYFPVLESLRNELDAIEGKIFANVDQDFLQSVFSIKKQLLHFRRLVHPLRDLLATLLKRDSHSFGSNHGLYLQDVYDHLIRISDSIDTLREQMTSTVDLTIDLYLANSSNRMNVVMKNLTVISTCMMVVTLISSVYGMNFKYMPELEWRFGYPFALALMGVAVGIVLGLFRWRKYI